jgi:hypothetical protein
MGFIRTLLGLVILAVILVFGYWLYASYSTAPAAPYWAEINSYMPDPLRRWSCQQTRGRLAAAGQPAGSAPLGCEGNW